MGRYTSSRYDYPKEGQSLTEISQRMFGKRYIDTTDNEVKKIKAMFRKVN